MTDATIFPFDSAQLAELSKKFGTPLYVYDQKTIEKKATELTSLFKDYPVKWLYAMKANDNPHILSIISRSGFGFDTVSLEEAVLATHFLDDRSDIFYTENNMSDSEMFKAMELGVRLNIGSLYRLEKFGEAGGKACSVRLNPDIGDGHHARVTTGNKESKFGITLENLDKLQAISEKYGIKIVGIHAHIGSGIQKPENMLAAMKKLIDISKKFADLDFINFGGGLPIPYTSAEGAFDTQRFDKLAGDLFAEDIKTRKEGFHYIFEPGRWLVAQAGTLTTEITCVKQQGDICYLGTDTGFNHLARPVIYNSVHRVFNLTSKSEVINNYTVSGNICESSDILAKDIELKESTEGDILALADAGAYGMTMASEYNRRILPAEVLIKSDGEILQIRKRPSVDEHINQFFAHTNF